MISEQAKKEIDFWITKYPDGRESSAVMQALTIVQNENGGSLTGELMQEVADHLKMPAISVQEVATFYENYNHKPVGKHVIRFCHNISCMLNGSDDLISYLEEKLQVKTGEISKDGLVSVKKVECLGACANAPMVQIGKDYYEDLTAKKLADLIDEFDNGKIPIPGPQNGRYAAEPEGGLTSLKDYKTGALAYNASAQTAVDLQDTVKRIDGTEVPLLTPWLGDTKKSEKI